jgi:hypothetical protein
MGARLLGVQKAFLRAFELLFRQSTVGAQFRQFAEIIGKRHGALLEIGFITLEHRNREKVAANFLLSSARKHNFGPWAPLFRPCAVN